MRIVDGEIWRDDELVAIGQVLTEPTRSKRRWRTRAPAIGVELERFAENTLEYIRPRSAAHVRAARRSRRCARSSQGRHALVVVRGHDYRSDLAALRPYIREYRPVLIGVDGGADALLEVGFKPDVIIGDFDSVSEPRAALRRRARAPRASRRSRAGPREPPGVGRRLPGVRRRGHERGRRDAARVRVGAPQLIVAVGTHATMVEFLDKGRRGMASTFLTRLRLGPMLVDAKGVSRLYEGRVRRLDMLLLVGAAVLAMVVVGIVAEPIHVFLRGLWVTLKDVFSS